MVGIRQDALHLASHASLYDRPHIVQTSPDHWTSFLNKLVQPPPVLVHLVTTPADSSIQQGTLHHWFVKHVQHVTAHIERAQPAEEVEPTLPLLVDGSSVEGPVQLVIQVDTQVLVTRHHLNLSTIYADGQGGRLGLTAVLPECFYSLFNITWTSLGHRWLVSN